MEIVLIPGLWLDRSSRDRVFPVLRQAGHRPHALTQPGLESKDADRSEITLRDHVDAVVEVIDSTRPAATSCSSGTPAAARSPMPPSMRGPTGSPASSTSTAGHSVPAGH